MTFTNVGGSPLLRNVPNVNPNTQPGISGAILATDNRQPRTQSWSFTVQRRLPYQMTIEAGYVGSKSDRLLNDGINNLNNVPLGAMINDPTGDPNNYRPLPGVRRPSDSQHTHYQNYNALQMLLSRSSSKFSYTASYTWSKALGILGGGAGGQGNTTQPAGDIRDSAYGVLGYDSAHVLNIGYSYLFPSARRRGGAQEGAARRLAVHRCVDLHQRRAAPAAGVDRHQLRPGGNGRQWRRRSPTARSSPVRRDISADASADLRSAPGRQRRPDHQPELLRAADAGLERELHLPGPARTRLHQPRLRGVQELPDGRSRKFQFRASFTNVFNHPQRFFDDNQNLKLQFTNGQLRTTRASASCRATTSSAGASSSSPSRCISSRLIGSRSRSDDSGSRRGFDKGSAPAGPFLSRMVVLEVARAGRHSSALAIVRRFTVAVIASLTLGIGANAAMFALLNALAAPADRRRRSGRADPPLGPRCGGRRPRPLAVARRRVAARRGARRRVRGAHAPVRPSKRWARLRRGRPMPSPDAVSIVLGARPAVGRLISEADAQASAPNRWSCCRIGCGDGTSAADRAPSARRSSSMGVRRPSSASPTPPSPASSSASSPMSSTPSPVWTNARSRRGRTPSCRPT